MPEASGLCGICFYYHSDRNGRGFWDCQGDYLFPYNIGDRMLRNMMDQRPLYEGNVNWRDYLASTNERIRAREGQS